MTCSAASRSAGRSNVLADLSLRLQAREEREVIRRPEGEIPLGLSAHLRSPD